MNYSEELKSISDAKGIGPSSLQEFEKARLTNPEEIGKLDALEIKEQVDGVGYKTAVNVLRELQKQGYREKDIEKENKQELISLLESLFEFDKKDRDFGVYKLMNQKREEVEDFIYNELLHSVEKETKEFGKVDEKELEKEREKIRKNLGSSVIKTNGDIKEEYKDAPIVQEYLELTKSKGETPENIKAEIYNHIYKFFNRYYEDGDFITKRYRTSREPKYSVPYNGEETHFHWATKNQYYAKTSENFTRFSFKHKNYKYKFITKNIDPDEDLEVDDEYFVMQKSEKASIDKEKKEVEIYFERRGLTQSDLDRAELSTRTQNKKEKLVETFAEELTQHLSKKKVEFKSKKIEKKIEEYTARNTSDFFIHKNLEEFLLNELEEYVKQEVMSYDPKNGFTEDNTAEKKASIINEICVDIISFLSNIEEFKKKLFEKKKFVKESRNLIPVGEIDKKYYETILENKDQLEEWEDSFRIDKEKLDPELLSREPYNRMIVDTNLYEEDLVEEQPENKLVKGENYQALNFLKEKYKNSVKCIYIDPPYNTGNANFAYKDNYQRSTWLSLMYDRLKVSKQLLSDKGAIFVSIDYNELHTLKLLMSEIYGEDNFTSTFVWKRRAGGGQDSKNNVAIDHEYVVCFSKTDEFKAKGIQKTFDRYSNPDNDPRGEWVAGDLRSGDTKKESPSLYYSITDPETGNKFEADPDSVWRLSEDTMEEYIEEDRILFPDDENGVPKLKRFKNELRSKRKPVSSWIETSSIRGKEIKNREKLLEQRILQTGLTGSGTREVQNVFGYKPYDYPKPVNLIKNLVEQCTDSGGIVLDFFAGSGTTAQAVQELNQELDEEINYVLVEMLDEAFDIAEERIKRGAFSNEWKDGEPQVEDSNTLDSFSEEDVDLPDGVQCLSLESYEEALDAIEFEDEQSSLSDYKEYLINYMLDFETSNSSILLDFDKLSTPKQYKLNLGSQEDIAIDVMETFSYLIGLDDVEVSNRAISGAEYTIYKGEVGEESTLVIWRHNEDVDFKEEREEIEHSGFDKIYVNGDSCIPNSRMIQPVFKKKMFHGDSQ